MMIANIIISNEIQAVIENMKEGNQHILDLRDKVFDSLRFQIINGMKK